MSVERVVHLAHKGQRFTFRIDPRPPLKFWRVESAGRIYVSPLSVTGHELPPFFQGLADVALREWRETD
jgi:hypothetical protein